MSDFLDRDGFDKATRNGRGQYAAPGFYPKIQIDGLKTVDCAKDQCKGVVVEYTILESDVPECKPGAGYSYVMKDKHPSFFSNLRTIVADLTGADFKAVDREKIRGALSEVQPLEGSVASLRVTQLKTRAGGDYSAHNFRLIELGPKIQAAIKAAQEATQQS